MGGEGGNALSDPVGPRTGRKDAWAAHSGNPPVEGLSVLWARSLGSRGRLRHYNSLCTLCTHQALSLSARSPSARSVFFGKVKKGAQLVPSGSKAQSLLTLRPTPENSCAVR